MNKRLNTCMNDMCPHWRSMEKHTRRCCMDAEDHICSKYQTEKPETAWDMWSRLDGGENQNIKFIKKIKEKCFPDMFDDYDFILASFHSEYTAQEAIKIMQKIEKELKGE